ncbi:protein max-like [Littorina saxatilis]|uniref:BHLH domain-containing protein n=1 Tax=Littorina saxatilis TaxID=31220 RepID=A0AAN9AN49_9CAEN
MSNEEENVDVDGLSGSDDSYYTDGEDDQDDENGDQVETTSTSRRIPKRKVAHHNALEKQRRNDLTAAFDTLLNTIKKDSPTTPKMSRDAIIAEALDKVKFMTEEHKQILALTEKVKQFSKKVNDLKKEKDEEDGLSDADSGVEGLSSQGSTTAEAGSSTEVGRKVTIAHHKSGHSQKRKSSPGQASGKKMRKTD